MLLSPQQVVIGDTKDITGTKSPNTMVDQVLEIWMFKEIEWIQAYLAEYQDFNGGPVAFGGVKVTLMVKMCDKKNKVLFTDTECPVLSPEFKLPDENQV
ncbi:hypothetical protein Tco_0640324 [Tanacetum coccineum]